jgi:hypothetical protein
LRMLVHASSPWRDLIPSSPLQRSVTPSESD